MKCIKSNGSIDREITVDKLFAGKKNLVGLFENSTCRLRKPEGVSNKFLAHPRVVDLLVPDCGDFFHGFDCCVNVFFCRESSDTHADSAVNVESADDFVYFRGTL